MVNLQTGITITPQEAETLLARWLRQGTHCTQASPLSGGMINSVLDLRFDHSPGRAVLKLNAAPGHDGFAAEQRRLDYLHAHTALPCPRVYLQGARSAAFPYDHLLLEALPGVNMGAARLEPQERTTVDRELAQALLELDSHERDTFGPIEHAGTIRWSEVMAARLMEVRQEVEHKLPAAVLANIDAALDVAGEVLHDQGRPTLIHGDIWACNVMVVQQDDGWHLSGLLDPGLEFADVECELAYLDVFNTVGPAFFELYTAHRPFRPGYALRRLFYWLNTYLVHVWIFGDQHYREATAAVASAIVRRI